MNQPNPVSASGDAPAQGSALDPYRLPRAALPRRYDITLSPDLARAEFGGAVRVEIDVVESPLAEVALNAIELEIHACEIDEAECTFRLENAAERLFVRPPKPLEAGTHTLTIRFSGTINDKLRGFYRSTYRDASGAEHVIATTSMQPADCRRAFPCWDEPDFKAAFGITLVVEPGLTAIANGPEVQRETVKGGQTAITFADSMVMSTYLVAFVVGPLEATAPRKVEGNTLRAVYVPGKGHLTDFGLDVAAFSLRWFQDYYGIPYPAGDKTDLLAVPDFSAGAMENPGCITFRENLLLVDPTRATQNEVQLVADVVTHEFAHMWFGNLVTMRWWNGIWLNEAFATFMAIAACDAFRPAWQRWTSFGIERSFAFETDSLSSTRAVEFEVRSPDDCQGMFDVLTYQKGGALLRMLEQHLGPERFREGVSHYLRKHAYGNTETSDLWDAIEETSGEPVRRLMDSWIWQPGYPLVSATLEGGTLVLRQRRFAFGKPPDASARWVVPVGVRNGGKMERVLLEGDEVKLPLASASAPVVVNAGGHGFFRVAYDETLRARLSGAALGELDTLERYNLVDDAWNAVVAGEMPASNYLEFVSGFANETEHAVWQAIVIGLRGIGRLLDDAPYERYQRRVAALLEPVVARLGDPAPGEDALTAKLRGLLVGALAVLGGHAPTRQHCRALFAQALADPAHVDPELLQAATSAYAASGGPAEFEVLLDGYRRGGTPQERLRYLYALPQLDDAKLLAQTCELAMSDEVKTQDAPFVLNSCIANRRFGSAAFRFVRDHWKIASERFPANTIVRMVDSVRLLNRAVDVATARDFFAGNPIPQAAATLRQVLERQHVNAALRARESARLPAALD
jgi:puromycin-sensitive aminopeptidase